MSSTQDARAALFLAPPAAETAEQLHGPRDAGEEAMHRLRHPFDVAPGEVSRQSALAGELG